MPKFKDLSGEKFGLLTVLFRTDDKVDASGNKRVAYHCICDCGTEVDVRGNALSGGRTRSCGCLQMQYAKSGAAQRRHGGTGSRLYNIWKGIHRRCYNENATGYSYYGGNGIAMCDEWVGRDGFENFKVWAIEHGYKDDLTIERVDINKGYSPSNCCWVTRREQQRNKSTNRFIEYNGVRQPICCWSELIGVSKKKLYKSSDDGIIKYIEEYYRSVG